jgi:hypothetical protein
MITDISPTFANRNLRTCENPGSALNGNEIIVQYPLKRLIQSEYTVKYERLIAYYREEQDLTRSRPKCGRCRARKGICSWRIVIG